MTPEELFRSLVELPREAGTAAAAEARSLVTRHLESRGYRVRVQPFSFQTASVNVLPILGAGLGWLTLLEVPLLLLGRLSPLLAPLVWLAGTIALGALAWGIGTGAAVPGAERREDANLIVTRGTSQVRRWIVAHLDSKAQGHSMAGRLVAVWVLILAALGLGLLSAARLVGPLPSLPVAAAAGVSVAAGALASRGRLKGTSPGASDNGTGVLAALLAAEALRDDGVGFLFTGAEEFGMVGARAFQGAEGVSDRAEIVNLDTLTDEGPLFLVYHDPPGLALARRLQTELSGVGTAPRIRQLPLGILVDSLPFARGGRPAVTLARLDCGVLARIHTPRDGVEQLGLKTACEVGRALGTAR